MNRFIYKVNPGSFRLDEQNRMYSFKCLFTMKPIL